MDSGQEQNYWPGFVDALSNVVLTLIFVLVVFVFALSMSAQKVEKRMQEVVEAEKAQKAKFKTDEVATGTGSTATPVQNSAVQKVELTVKETDKPTINTGAVNVVREQDRIILSYPDSVVELDAQSMTDLDKAIAAAKGKGGTYTLLVNAQPGQESYSAAQRLAYYRALRMRNYLITKGMASNSAVQMKIVQPTKPDIGHVEIIFQRQ